MNDSISPFTIEEYMHDFHIKYNTFDTSKCSSVLIWSFMHGELAHMRAKIRECKGDSLIVGGLPADFSHFLIHRVYLGDTNIRVLDYIGTYELGILFLNTPIKIEVGKYINIKIIK